MVSVLDCQSTLSGGFFFSINANMEPKIQSFSLCVIFWRYFIKEQTGLEERRKDVELLNIENFSKSGN